MSVTRTMEAVNTSVITLLEAMTALVELDMIWLLISMAVMVCV